VLLSQDLRFIRLCAGVGTVLLLGGVVLLPDWHAAGAKVAGVCFGLAVLSGLMIFVKAGEQLRLCCPVCGSSRVPAGPSWVPGPHGLGERVWRDPVCIVCMWRQGQLVPGEHRASPEP
jgi:hypothetical protein